MLANTLLLALLAPACNGGGPGSGLGECEEGELSCDGEVRVECDRRGNWQELEVCDEACDVNLGCVTCVPLDTRCVEGASEICLDDGSGWVLNQVCDAEQGLVCDEELGSCAGACAVEELGEGLAGCDFWSVESFRASEAADYNLVVLNLGNQDANVVVDRGPDRLHSFSVKAGKAEEIELDYLVLPSAQQDKSVVAEDLGQRVRSDSPVLVFQGNSLWSSSANIDGDAVLPAHRLGTSSVAATYQGYSETCQSHLRVVATQDGTSVSTVGQGKTQAGDGIDKKGNAEAVLDAGDGLWLYGDGDSDLSGTVVEASAPVQVHASNDCARVPYGDGYYDHLQAFMWHAETAGTDFAAFQMRDDDEDTPQYIEWRVFGLGEAATISTEPDVGLSGTVGPGEYVELLTTEAFTLSASAPVMLVAYNATDGGSYRGGESSMTVMPPTSLFASSSTTYCPDQFDYCWIHVVSDQATASINGDSVQLEHNIGGWNYGWFDYPEEGVVRVEASGQVWAYANSLETYYRASLLLPGSYGN